MPDTSTITALEFANHCWDLIRCNEKVKVITEPAMDVSTVWISKLYSPQKIRRCGFAREAMERICQAADEASITLQLMVESEGAMSNAMLLEFYESLGFELTDGELLYMTRLPNNEEI